MRANQLLDGLSQTLMQDERILSSSEKELVRNLLQKAGAASCGNPEVQNAVTSVLHRAVGETVAQRAFELLGGSILQQLLATTSEVPVNETITLGPQPPGPQPPSGPHGPGVKRPPLKDQPLGPQPPSSPGPHGLQPFTVDAGGKRDQGQTVGASGVEVLEAPVELRARCVVLDEFLAPQELDDLVQYTIQHESDFRVSEVISPSGDEIDCSHRRSHVLTDLQTHEDVIVDRIRGVLPQVLQQLGMKKFSVNWVETQITASNDGDYFHIHCDNAQDPIASRKLTFVYFFHREPCPFKGGELRLYDQALQGEGLGAGSYQTIVPRQNQIVFFPCSVPHEITPVECPSRAFADSRFTVNGWLHQ